MAMNINFSRKIDDIGIYDKNWLINYLLKKGIPICKELVNLNSEDQRKEIDEKVCSYCRGNKEEYNKLIKSIYNSWTSKVYRENTKKIKTKHLNINLTPRTLNRLNMICSCTNITLSDLTERIIQSYYNNHRKIKNNDIALDLDLINRLKDMINERENKIIELEESIKKKDKEFRELEEKLREIKIKTN